MTDTIPASSIPPAELPSPEVEALGLYDSVETGSNPALRFVGGPCCGCSMPASTIRNGERVCKSCAFYVDGGE